MSLLSSRPPTSVVRIGTELMFDTDTYVEPDEVFDIAVSYGSILEIFSMLNGNGLTDNEKQICLLRAFYLDCVPEDLQQAYGLAVEFMACGKGVEDKKSKEKPLYSWEQDGDYIFAAINQTYNNILNSEPDLHWWKFINCFINLVQECRFNEIINNRAAHRKPNLKANIPSKEQKEARRLYPEIYVLKEHRVSDTETLDKLRDLEKIMNGNSEGC